MNRISHLIVTAAACATLSTAALAQQSGGTATDGTERQGSSLDQTGRDSQRTGSGMGSMGTGSSKMDMSKMDMQGDKQLMQAFQQVASDPTTASDKMFVLEAAMMDMMEIQGAQLAQQKAQSQGVKDLARQIQQDHSQSLQQLQQIAQSMNLTLPTTLPSHVQQKLMVKSMLPAAKFDMAYLASQQESHAKAVTSYALHQNMVQDQQLKQYVSQTLPKVQQHTQHILQVSQQAGVPNGISMINAGSGQSGMRGSSGTGSTGSRGNVENEGTRVQIEGGEAVRDGQATTPEPRN